MGLFIEITFLLICCSLHNILFSYLVFVTSVVALTDLRKYATVAHSKKLTERNVLVSYYVLEKISKVSTVYTETKLSVKETLFIIL